MIKKLIHFKLISFFILLLLIISCSNDKWYFKEVGTLLWINELHDDATVKRAIEATLSNSSIIVSQVSWQPYDSLYFKNISWYEKLAREHGKSFMINLDWLKNDRSGIRGDQDFYNEKIKSLFFKDIKRIVDTYNPDYLTLGIEVNYYALTSPRGYNSFVQIFNELKGSLKKTHPKLKIGLSFQLELLYGFHKNWNKETTLQVLNAVVENLDYLGVSTYPDVSDVDKINSFNSLNYLDSLSNSYNIPIGILETGITSIKYNDNDRARYINEVFRKTSELDLKFLIWGSIIDSEPIDTNFQNFGLLDFKGFPKAEYQIWVSESQKMLN